MKNLAQRDWRNHRSSKKAAQGLDQTVALGGVTLALFTYILYHFIYPLLSKGLLW